MTIARNLVEKLDNPATRRFLEAYSTWHAKRISGRNICIRYDDYWMHFIDDLCWVDSKTYAYNRLVTPKWLRYADCREPWGRDFWFHLYTPQQGDVIVDIGAGSGTDLPLFSSQVGDAGRVIAIEAHPQTFAMMELAVKHNQLGNVDCFQNAVVDKPCVVSITDDDKHVSNAITRENSDSSDASFQVKGCTLKSICELAGASRIDLLKMNIEGAEKYAIHGMIDLLPKTKFVCIACHDFRADQGHGEEFRTRKVVTEFLQDHGFQVFARDSDSRPHVRDHLHGKNERWLESE
jgi:FkbM family methyltransferase